MAYGVNRAGQQTRAHFQVAGGALLKFRHPFLAGQIDKSSNLDEIDVSSCLKLDATFIEAQANMDASKQVVLVDGSIVSICNKVLAGTMTLPVIRTTSDVASGDFVSALQLIRSVGDSVGGIFTATYQSNGKAITYLFYGVTLVSVPDLILMGNDVPVYNCKLSYAGWIMAEGKTTASSLQNVWAVGAQSGISGYYNQYTIQQAGTGTDALSSTNNGLIEGSNSVVDNSHTDGENVSEEYTNISATDSPYRNVVDAQTQLTNS